MRHNVAGRKLGRTTSHRLAMFRNQLASLVKDERIVTTLPKAKELRPIAERVVTRGKLGSVPARRWVGQWIADRDLIHKLFTEIAPRFTERAGGYLRIVKLGPRPGDGAEMAVLEFVDYAKKNDAAPADGGTDKKAKGTTTAVKTAKPKTPKVSGKANPKAKSPGEGKQAKRTKTARDVAAVAGEPRKQGRADQGATE